MRKLIETREECRDWLEANPYQLIFCKQCNFNTLRKLESPILFDATMPDDFSIFNVEAYYTLQDGDIVGLNTLEVVKPRMRPMVHDEVFHAISQGAKVRIKDENYPWEASNRWTTDCDVRDYEICYSNGGKATEDWQPMEVEV